MIRSRFAGVLLVLASSAQPLVAQEAVDLDMVTRIRVEGLEHSQVMDTLWHLTDRYGPRLTNSPQQRLAAEWAVGRLEEFGLANAAIEPWGEFGMGWSFERCVVEMTSPIYMPLIAFPKAWTAGTDGELSGEPVLVAVDTPDELEAFRGQLAGRIVLAGKPLDVASPWEPLAERYDAASLAELEAAPEPGAPSAWAGRRAEYRARRALDRAQAALFGEEGVALVVVPDGGRRNDYGVVMLGSGGSYDPSEPRALPQVVVSTEQYNRLARLIQHGETIAMRAEVATTFHEDDLVASNIVAELPGFDPDLRDEVVMLGAHFDSWHPGTGATDNGSSCAVMMEAMRILATIGLPPRRTIRVALWTGEEQGLLGSKGYVAEHFGDRRSMQLLPEHARLAAYFNLDNGGGKVRGVYQQGNAAVAPIFEAWLAPFHDLGATTLTMRDTGGTDHLSFDAIGLPGFQFIQDEIDYSSRTHHTNMDLYERVVPGDVMQAAVLAASFAWHAAMRDERLPRKPLPVAEPPEPTPAVAAPLADAAAAADAQAVGEAAAAAAAAGSADGQAAGEAAAAAARTSGAADAQAAGEAADAAASGGLPEQR